MRASRIEMLAAESEASSVVETDVRREYATEHPVIPEPMMMMSLDSGREEDWMFAKG